MHPSRRILLVLPVLAALLGPAAHSAQDLYVTNNLDSSISVFDIGAGGVPAPVAGSPFGTSDDPFGVVLSNDGSRLYAVSGMEAEVVGYSVGPGGLTPLPGSP